MANHPISRRSLIKAGGLTLLGAQPIFALSGFAKPKRRLGVALVGLGYYSTDLLAPALQQTQHCHLAGIVTGSPEKIPVWQKAHGIPDKNVYNYANMHQMADNADIDVVYVVLPNSMHKKYSIIAAEAGKHVWCEKPMAMNSTECEDMIAACRKNKVKLSIGYRLQHEPNTRDIIQIARDKPFGKIQSLTAEAGFRDERDHHHWRQDKSMGGGAMYDMGVYPLNASRYSTAMEPIAVTARHEVHRPKLYGGVDETTYFTLEFPGGTTAECVTSFGKRLNNKLHVSCADGWYELHPFQTYTGVKGKTSDGREYKPFGGNQQARQMDDDALAILNDQPVLVPGEEGLRDMRVVDAVYESGANDSKRVEIR